MYEKRKGLGAGSEGGGFAPLPGAITPPLFLLPKSVLGSKRGVFCSRIRVPCVENVDFHGFWVPQKHQYPSIPTQKVENGNPDRFELCFPMKMIHFSGFLKISPHFHCLFKGVSTMFRTFRFFDLRTRFPSISGNPESGPRGHVQSSEVFLCAFPGLPQTTPSPESFLCAFPRFH